MSKKSSQDFFDKLRITPTIWSGLFYSSKLCQKSRARSSQPWALVPSASPQPWALPETSSSLDGTPAFCSAPYNSSEFRDDTMSSSRHCQI